MKKLQTIRTVLAIFVLAAMCACTKSPEQAIVGKWKVVKNIGGISDLNNAIWEFKSDGYFAFYEGGGDNNEYWAHEGTYTVNDNNIEIILPAMHKGDDLMVLAGTIQEISNDKLTLNLTGGVHLEFVRTNETIQIHVNTPVIVEHPEPSIAFIIGEGYLADGDVVEIGVLYRYGLRAASNSETMKELSKLDVVCDGAIIFEKELSCYDYDYSGWVEFTDEMNREIVGSAEIIAKVTDIAGQTNQARIKVEVIQQDVELEVNPFSWYRDGGAQGVGLDDFGLKWVKNQRDIYAVIEPVDGAVLFSFPSECWDMIVTATDKEEYFEDAGTPIEDYRGVSCTAPNKYYDDVIGTIYHGEYHLIHITESVSEIRKTITHIYGETK